MQTCESCGRVYEYKRRSGHTKRQCNSCLVNKRRFEKKERAVALLGGECNRCGYKACIQALCFHHKDPREKSFTLSGSHALSWKRWETELKKCILLCHNCHLELHAGLWSLPE